MMPSIYLYHNRNRWFVLGYLLLLIAFSTTYLFLMSWHNNFSSMLNVSDNKMFDELYRAPFGPVGYYALGIMLSIFYFEYSQAISNRELRKRNAYRFMSYIGRSKSKQLIFQLIGLVTLFFVLFVRYWSFAYAPIPIIEQGRWPSLVNAIFNATSHYIFIASMVLIFLPIFIGKLSIVRDIFASSFFRPLARVSFSALIIHGLMLFLVFFRLEQSVYFDHKNMIFIYFSLIFFTYVIAVFIALFLEYPFRTMAKVVFSPPKKILRLNRELAKELNTNIDNIFNDSEEEDEVASQRNQSGLLLEEDDNLSMKSANK